MIFFLKKKIALNELKNNSFKSKRTKQNKIEFFLKNTIIMYIFLKNENKPRLKKKRLLTNEDRLVETLEKQSTESYLRASRAFSFSPKKNEPKGVLCV